MKLNSFLRFGIVGTLAFLVDAGVLYTLLFCGIHYFYGRLVSFVIVVMLTWQLNRKFTFVRCPDQSLLQEACRYFLVSCIGGSVNITIYSLLVLSNPSPLMPLIGVASGSIAGMCINFFAAKHFVFQSR